MPENNNNLRLRTIGFVVAVVLSIAAVYGYRYYFSFHHVTFQAKYGTHIAIGTAKGETDEGGLRIDNVIATSDNGDSVRLRDGAYIVHFYGGDYQEQYQNITISGDTTVTTPVLSYSSDKLTKTLTAERPFIAKAVAQVLDPNQYSLSSEVIYRQGDWYAAVYKPKSPSYDIQRLILHKDTGSWQLAAFPSIVFYVGDLPKVPSEIVRDINNK